MNCHDRQNKNVRKFNNVPNFFWYITQTMIKYQEYQNQLYIILYIEIFMTPFMVHLCWYGCMKYRNSKWFSDCVKLHFLLHRQFFKMCNLWNSWYHFMRIKFGHFCFCACWDEESWFYHYSIVINFISHVIIQPKSICSFGGTSVTSTHTSVLL